MSVALSIHGQCDDLLMAPKTRNGKRTGKAGALTKRLLHLKNAVMDERAIQKWYV